MKKIAMLVAMSAVYAWGQSQSQPLDFSSLDKLESKAKEVNRVSLDENQLKAAMQMMPHDSKKGEQVEHAKKLMSGLQSVFVRNYEFEQQGLYQDSDLDAIRNQMEKLKGWSKIVDSKEKNEHSQIFMYAEGDKPMGIGIIAAEPKEISIVVVKGPLNLSDLGQLQGLAGLPNIQLGPGAREDNGRGKEK